MTSDRYQAYQERLDAGDLEKDIEAILDDLERDDPNDRDIESIGESAAMILAIIEAPNDPRDERIGTQ